MEVTSLGAVSLTVDTPLWSGRLGGMVAELLVVDGVVVRLPVAGRVAQILSSILKWGAGC